MFKWEPIICLLLSSLMEDITKKHIILGIVQITFPLQFLFFVISSLIWKECSFSRGGNQKTLSLLSSNSSNAERMSKGIFSFFKCFSKLVFAWSKIIFWIHDWWGGWFDLQIAILCFIIIAWYRIGLIWMDWVLVRCSVEMQFKPWQISVS